MVKRIIARFLLAKAFLFRIVVIGADFLIIYLILQDVSRVTGITLFRHAVQTIIYFFHDYFWLHVVKSGETLFTIPIAVVKTFTFRGIAVINDLTLLYLFTSEVGTSVELAFFITVANTIIYYIFEVLWQRSHTKPPIHEPFYKRPPL